MPTAAPAPDAQPLIDQLVYGFAGTGMDPSGAFGMAHPSGVPAAA